MKQENDKIGFWAYIWREMKKVSWKDVCTFIANIIGICVVLYAIELHIDHFLQGWLHKWINPLDKWPIITAIYIVAVFGIIAYLLDHIKNVSLSAPWLGVWIVVTIIYTYYRVINKSVFEFWHTGWWTWLDVIYVIDALILIASGIYIYCAWRREQKAFDSKGDLLRDDAIRTEKEDSLKYKAIADGLQERIDGVDLSERAYSVGIAGDWGIGKSSLLNLFAEKQQNARQIVVRFAPRSAKNIGLIQEEFFSVFTHELSKYSFAASTAIGKYKYALNLHSSTRWIYAILELFEQWTAESERERINAIIRATGKRVFVIIEDLDRLTGSEILEVLKLIDANGNFCNTIFLSAYDKKYVNGVLQRVIGFEDAKTDFTDKYFQYEWPIFKQNVSEVYKFLCMHLYSWAINVCGDEYLRHQIEKEWGPVVRILWQRIETLREAKRYINLFRASYVDLKEKVDFADYTIVTLIRFLDSETYYDIYMKKYLEYKGKLFLDRTAYCLKANYVELAQQSKIDTLAPLLEALFPTEGSYRQFDSEYNRIHRVASFDNYFYSEIDGKLYYGDINQMMHDATIKEALERFDRININDTARQCIEEFLIYRDARWILAKERLTRYVCLVLYADMKFQNLYIRTTLNGILLKKTSEDYEEYFNNGEYWDAVKEAFAIMMEYIPSTINAYMGLRLKDRYMDTTGDLDELFIDTKEYDQVMLIESQKRYDALCGNGDWDARRSLQAAMPIEKENDEQQQARLGQMKQMLLIHPDDYAKGMMLFETSPYEKKATIIRLLYSDNVKKALGKRPFTKWTEGIQDENVRYIIERLYAEKSQKDSTTLRIEQHIEQPEQNYARVAELLKKEE